MDSRNSTFDFFFENQAKNLDKRASREDFLGQIFTLKSNLNSAVISRTQKMMKRCQENSFFWSQFKTYYDVVKNQLKQLNEALKSLLRLRKSCCTCEEGFLKSFQCQTLIQRRNLPPKIFIMSYFKNLSRKSGIHGIITSVLPGKKWILSSDSNSAWKFAQKNLL